MYSYQYAMYTIPGKAGGGGGCKYKEWCLKTDVHHRVSNHEIYIIRKPVQKQEHYG